MRTVLGLSLKSNDVAWVILDAADSTVLDHDALEFHGNPEVVGAAARSAHTIARASGLEISRIRLTWTDEAAHSGFQLYTRLRHLAPCEVDAVPMACATAVCVDPEATGITPRLALAYGAALAVVGPSEPTTVAAVQPVSTDVRPMHRRVLSAVLGGAAAATLGLLCLSAGEASHFEPAEATAQESGHPDTGWATVRAPSDIAATSERKIVATLPNTEQHTGAPAQSYPPVRVVAATAPEPIPVSTELPHLSGALPGAGLGPGLADPAAAPQPEPDMAAVANALRALP